MVTVKEENLSRKKEIAPIKQKAVTKTTTNNSLKKETLPVKTEQILNAKVAKDPKVAKKRVSWEQRYDQCKEFKKRYGHCKIPTALKENKSLGIWVQEIRRNFKRMMTGKKPRCVLNKEMIDKLNEIEFYWGFTPDPNQFKESDSSWEENFKELQKFKNANGNFDVPMDGDNALRKLAIWTRVQRTQRKNHKSKTKSFISKGRINKLEAIGFDWEGEEKIN